MSMKEHFKEKKEELEEILILLKIPRYTWRQSKLLFWTLEFMRFCVLPTYSYLHAKAARASDLVIEINSHN